MEDGKSRALATVLSASATLKPAPTEAQTVLFFFFLDSISSFSVSISELFVQDPVHIYSFISAPPDWALVSVSATLAPSLNSTSNPQH